MRSNQSGLSLIEVMIGLIILAFISIATYEATRNSFESVDKITKEDKDRLKIITALNLLEWDFSQIYSPLYFSKKFDLQKLKQTLTESGQTDSDSIAYNLEQAINYRYRNNKRFYLPSQDGSPIPRFISPEKDRFEFFTTSNRRLVTNSPTSVFAWVVYTLETPTNESVERMREISGNENIEPGKNWVRYVISTDPFSPEDSDITSSTNRLKGQVLLDKVDQLEFTFWDPNKRQFVNLDQIPDGQGKIDAIKVKIIYRNLYNNPQTLQKIYRNFWPKLKEDDEQAGQNDQTQGS